MWGEPSCRVKWDVGVWGGMIVGTRASSVALAIAEAEVHPEPRVASLRVGFYFDEWQDDALEVCRLRTGIC